MNAKDRYDHIITAIEENAQDPFQTAMDIAQSVADDNIMSLRESNTVMKFLTDRLLLPYIRERKMMAAYRYLISSDQSKIRTACEIAGKGTDSAFSTDFKTCFGMTPTEAKQIKDYSLISAPLTWNAISCETINPPKEDEVEQMENANMFGIPMAKYEKMIEATDLAALYDFTPNKSNLAFSLSEDLDLPLKSTFRFVSELDECFCCQPEDEEETLSIQADMKEVAQDQLLQFLFFKCNLPVDLAFEVTARMPLSHENIMKLNPFIVELYAHIEDMNFSFFTGAIQYYNERSDDTYDDDTFNEFIDMICQGLPVEVAFQRLIPLGDIDDFDIDLDEEPDSALQDWDSAIEREAREDERWSGTRIDQEIDPDNIEYSCDEDSGAL